MEKKKVILYCRVASNKQADKELNIQEQNLREYGTMRNYEIAEVITETGSGANLNRPGINKIYEIIDRQKIDAVIAKNISRYSRCPSSEIVNFIEELAKKGVKTMTLMDGNLQDILPILKSTSFSKKDDFEKGNCLVLQS